MSQIWSCRMVEARVVKTMDKGRLGEGGRCLWGVVSSKEEFTCVGFKDERCEGTELEAREV